MDVRALLLTGLAVCGRLTQRMVDTIAAGGILAGAGGSCPSAVAALSTDLGPAHAAELRHARLLTLTVDGGHATATDSTGGTPDRFTKIGGSWYLSGGIS